LPSFRGVTIIAANFSIGGYAGDHIGRERLQRRDCERIMTGNSG
jgi:hypothetical protein